MLGLGIWRGRLRSACLRLVFSLLRSLPGEVGLGCGLRDLCALELGECRRWMSYLEKVHRYQRPISVLHPPLPRPALDPQVQVSGVDYAYQEYPSSPQTGDTFRGIQ